MNTEKLTLNKTVLLEVKGRLLELFLQFVNSVPHLKQLVVPLHPLPPGLLHLLLTLLPALHQQMLHSAECVL